MQITTRSRSHSIPSARTWPSLRRARSGQSLLEAALLLTLITTLTIYSVDYGYFFIVAADLTAAAQNAAEASVLGFATPGQLSLPQLNVITGLVQNELGGLVNASSATVTLCSKSLGVSASNVAQCSGTVPGIIADPEAPAFSLSRLDITYTVHPPIPVSVLNAALIPTQSFHRYVVMRSED